MLALPREKTTGPVFPFHIKNAVRFLFKPSLTGIVLQSPVLCSLCVLYHAVGLAVFLPALHIEPALSPAAPRAISLQEYGCAVLGRGCTAD